MSNAKKKNRCAIRCNVCESNDIISSTEGNNTILECNNCGLEFEAPGKKSGGTRKTKVCKHCGCRLASYEGEHENHSFTCPNLE